MTTGLEDLAGAIEDSVGIDAATADTVLAQLASHGEAGAAMTADDLMSTDAVLHLIDTIVPGWTIHLSGKALEPNGHWRCHLRKSSARDNDEFIGHGKGRTVAEASLAALLRTLAFLARH